ncbi:MAG: hypothetical protein JXQ96_21320 [Cyclobacteriaceae bacterium]
MDEKSNIEELQLRIDQLSEELFLSNSDLNYARTENVALKGFIQNLFESCEALEDSELELQTVLNNLKDNIREFSTSHNIRLS